MHQLKIADQSYQTHLVALFFHFEHKYPLIVVLLGFV